MLTDYFSVFVFRVSDLEFDQFYNPGLVAELLGDVLPGALVILRFNNRPSAMHTVFTASFEEVQVSRCMDISDH